ncbi:MAG: hypothetical protein ACOCXH_05090 [Cyclobacteriaceae bacterium]
MRREERLRSIFSSLSWQVVVVPVKPNSLAPGNGTTGFPHGKPLQDIIVRAASHNSVT